MALAWQILRRLRSPRVRRYLVGLWRILTAPGVEIIYEGIYVNYFAIEGSGQPTRLPWRTIIRRDPCVYCGHLPTGPLFNTIDHIMPLSRGGTYQWSNLAGACRRCNNDKGATVAVLFLAARERERRRVAARAAHKAGAAARASANKARCEANAAFVRSMTHR